jgi:restriction endonuclease S subunit
VYNLLTNIPNNNNNNNNNYYYYNNNNNNNYEHLEYITQEGEIIKNLNKGEFYKYLGINQSNHIQNSIIKENLEKQFYFSY